MSTNGLRMKPRFDRGDGFCNIVWGWFRHRGICSCKILSACRASRQRPRSLSHIRPSGASEPTAETEAFIAASRKAEVAARRRSTIVNAALYTMLVGIVLGLVGWINQPLERCYFTGLLSIQSRHGRDRSRFFAPKSNHPNVRGNSAKVAPNFIRLAAIGAVAPTTRIAPWAHYDKAEPGTATRAAGRRLGRPAWRRESAALLRLTLCCAPTTRAGASDRSDTGTARITVLTATGVVMIPADAANFGSGRRGC